MNDLNLDKTVCELVLKALNKYPNRKDVAKALGLESTRCVNTLIKKYKIFCETQIIYKVK